MAKADEILQNWNDDAREAATLVIEKYGEPHEACKSTLVWQNVGPWKRMVAYKDPDEHNFPAKHKDSVESFLAYNIPLDKVGDIVRFDGSVVVNRTRGELSARCHDEEANTLALNLAHDIIEGEKDVEGAREYYKKEFLDYRKGKPTPYMQHLNFGPRGGGDKDDKLISNEELEEAKKEGGK